MISEIRLIINDHLNPQVGFAIDETIMIQVYNSLSPSTIHFWSCKPTLSIGDDALEEEEINTLKRHGIELARRHTFGPGFYVDENTLVFSFIINTKNFDLPNNIQETYATIYSPIIRAVRSYGVPCIYEDPFYLVEDGKIVSQATQFWYYDVLVFQGVVYLDTNFTVPNRLNLLPRMITSIKNRYKESLSKEEFIKNTCIKIINDFKVKLVKGDLTPQEKGFLKTVLETKYTTEKWLLYGIPPLAYGKLLIELLLDNPPTETCSEIEENVKKAIEQSGEAQKIELRIWRKGEARPPGTTVSKGLIQAGKNSLIPAIIINGNLKFTRTAPSQEQILESIKEEMDKNK
ncbi:MAG: biotin/lipoate A/B protein ligase family protein [Candidatus Freyarchaeota archaeon]